jgi:phage/plasmid-associated DNA primase
VVKRDKYRKDHDWFGNFFEDCLVKAPTGFVSGTMVNALFHAWFFSKEGSAPRSAGAARKELRKAGYNESKKYETVGGQKKQVCGFEGLKPNESSEHYLKALEACARMRGE